MRTEDLRPRAIAIPPNDAVDIVEGIPTRKLEVKPIWTPFQDDLYLVRIIVAPSILPS